MWVRQNRIMRLIGIGLSKFLFMLRTFADRAVITGLAEYYGWKLLFV